MSISCSFLSPYFSLPLIQVTSYNLILASFVQRTVWVFSLRTAQAILDVIWQSVGDSLDLPDVGKVVLHPNIL